MANETKRKVTVQCRVSEDEFKELEKKADKIGLSVSSYLRMVCLMAEVNVILKPQQDSDN